jgi:hypothetical protein
VFFFDPEKYNSRPLPYTSLITLSLSLSPDETNYKHTLANERDEARGAHPFRCLELH